MNKYKSFVGPGDKYDLAASMQFNLLSLMGLRDNHKLLDIGCGSLRADRLFITYLNVGGYFGIEPEEWLVKEGIKNELGQDLIKIKKPEFIYTYDFEATKFQQKFDYVIAQSVFSHASKNQLTKCIEEVSNSLTDDGLFLAIIYLGG